MEPLRKTMSRERTFRHSNDLIPGFVIPSKKALANSGSSRETVDQSSLSLIQSGTSSSIASMGTVSRLDQSTSRVNTELCVCVFIFGSLGKSGFSFFIERQ
ncbi:hypothetical protein [Leptospirillum ferriphilum]|uniref:hypothetical protein n=1 Tax=Leptospirillum ferriphilum TaxID=178606 RepID=UPI0012377210|nr:hypothetical protein [Leptospirillum ferriphilum]